MNPASSTEAETARLTIAEQLRTVRTLLRLLDPSSPFQPILVGSIDLVAWQALFGEAVEAIERKLPRAIAQLPEVTRNRVAAAAAPLFSLSHISCDTPRVHLSEQALELEHYGLLPEDDGLHDSLAPRSPAEDELIARTFSESQDFVNQTARRLEVLRQELSATARHLIETLTQEDGILHLLKRRLKTSKRSKQDFQLLVDELEPILASPLLSPETPWKQVRWWFAQLAAALEFHVMPNLDAVLKTVAPRTHTRTSSGKKPAASSRQTLKNKLSRSHESFLQTLIAVRHVTASSAAFPLWRLFTGLLESLSSALGEADPQLAAYASYPGDERLIDGIAHLDPRLVTRPLLAAWRETIPAADDYTLQIALAGLHHLERPEEPADESAGRRQTHIHDFSEATMARWLSRGEYAGVNPDREISGRHDARIRRARRHLEHLRRKQAAFHGKRNWTPMPEEMTAGTPSRLWLVNPLLSLHPLVKDAIDRTPVPPVDGSAIPEPRRTPSRRNRGKPRKS